MLFFSNSNSNSNSNIGQKGMTLIEVMVALSIFALVVAGALSLFTSAQSTQSATQLKTNIYSIRAAIRNLYFGQGNYGGTGALLTPVLVASKKVPNTWVTSASSAASANSITTSLNNGSVTVAGGINTFIITITNVPGEVCQGVLSGMNEWTSIKAGGTTITGQKITPADATTMCSGATATIDLESN